MPPKSEKPLEKAAKNAFFNMTARHDLCDVRTIKKYQRDATSVQIRSEAHISKREASRAGFRVDHA